MQILFLLKGEACVIKNYIIERVTNEAIYIIDKQITVRELAKIFHVSKSTIHRDLTVLLPTIDNQLYEKVTHLLQANKAERHIRGGIATKLKYSNKESE